MKFVFLSDSENSQLRVFSEQLAWYLKIIFAFTLTGLFFLVDQLKIHLRILQAFSKRSRRIAQQQDHSSVNNGRVNASPDEIHRLIRIRIEELECTILQQTISFALEFIHNWETSGPIEKNLLTDKICAILEDKALYRKLLRYKDSDAQVFLNTFQWILDKAEDLPSSIRGTLIVALQRLGAAAELFPESYELFDITVPDFPESHGGFADIYKGVYGGRPVCLKVVRQYKSTMADNKRFIFNEAMLWKQLRHPNLLPLLGIYRHNGRIALVSPWMERGTVIEYITRPRRRNMNRISLVYDIARCLEFLHNNGIVHGDLSGTNVLVDRGGRVYIADLGLSSISDGKIVAWTSFPVPESKGGNFRYQAPQLFCEVAISNNKSSDIYAFGMLAYEIFTGQVPYAHLKNRYAVILRVSRGERPARPEISSVWSHSGLTEGIWSLMEACWDAAPEKRPSIQEITDFLASVLDDEKR